MKHDNGSDKSQVDGEEGNYLIVTDKELEPYRRILILAPHQDDETLGCGGLIQRFCSIEANVQVVFLTDGSMSHPHSSSHGSKERRNVRRLEAKEALAILGVTPEKIHFLDALDSGLPNKRERGYAYYYNKLSVLANLDRIDLILCPCLADPHRDHQAAWSLANDVALNRNIPFWEYPIWIYELGTASDRQSQLEKPHYCLLLSPEEQLQKMRALSCYRSQLDPLMFNDPEGFLLTPQMINHFDKHKEIFYPNQAHEQKNR